MTPFNSFGFLIVAALAQSAQPRIPPDGVRSTVRTVNSARVAPGVLASGQKLASQLLADAGVEIVWQDCSAGEVGPCANELGAREFWLHIADWRPVHGSGELLGFMARGGSVAGVYYPNVRKFATNFQIEQGDALGAVLAHEIGHLLGAGHRLTGIMCARFDRQSMVQLSQGGLLFTRDQAEGMRGFVTHGNRAAKPYAGSPRSGR
jgi:hypothetical protein